MNISVSFQRILMCVLVFFFAAGLSGCDGAANQLKYNRSFDKETQDYKDAMAPRLPEAEKNISSPESIPALQPYVAAASTNMKPMPLVSVSVNQSVPLRDILFELAEQADYDLELDPRITGSIIFTARNRPFDEVVQRIAEVAGLRYSFDNDVLRVELDTPYNKLYKIDYLSYIRSNKGSVRNNIAVVSGSGADTGSQFEAATESEANFWGELEQNLAQMLGGSVSGALKTNRTPRVTAVQTDAAPVAATANAAPIVDATGQVVQPPPAQPGPAVVNVQSLPVEEEPEPEATSPADGITFTLNKQAGLINVYAPEKNQKEVESYLKLLRKSVTAQVLIEAKLLEVELNDEYSTGINWRLLDGGDFALNFLSTGSATVLNNLGPATLPLAAGNTIANTSNFVVGFGGDDFQALIQAVSGFGTVHALASPRLTVLNNQSALLNVATNRVFFEIDVDSTTDEGSSQVTIDSDIRNVPEGVLVNVQPSINLDNNTISMAVRPTVTRVVAERSDPAVQYVTAAATPPITGVVSLVPELNVQEIDSVIQVRSGQAIIMGGLLQDRSETTDVGIPVLSDTPVLGNLFKQHRDFNRKTELVIFLKATILEAPEDSVHNTDKDLYRGFSGDRRPLKL